MIPIIVTFFKLTSIKAWGKVKLLSYVCPTFCDPMDSSLPGSTVHGIFQARILEWVAVSFSRRSFQPRDWTQVFRIVLLLLLSRFNRVRLCATPLTAAHQAPPSLGFSRQEHWSGLPLPSPLCESEKWKWSFRLVGRCFTVWATREVKSLEKLRPNSQEKDLKLVVA